MFATLVLLLAPSGVPGELVVVPHVQGELVVTERMDGPATQFVSAPARLPHVLPALRERVGSEERRFTPLRKAASVRPFGGRFCINGRCD